MRPVIRISPNGTDGDWTLTRVTMCGAGAKLERSYWEATGKLLGGDGGDRGWVYAPCGGPFFWPIRILKRKLLGGLLGDGGGDHPRRGWRSTI